MQLLQNTGVYWSVFNCMNFEAPFSKVDVSMGISPKTSNLITVLSFSTYATQVSESTSVHLITEELGKDSFVTNITKDLGHC